MTTRETEAKRVRAPLVPTMVSVEVPGGVPTAVVTSKLDVPAPLTDAGVNVAEAFAGNPDRDKSTVPVNPFSAPIVTV